MLSKERHHQHRSFFQANKLPEMFKKHTSGALSPETITTSSSGYSTGGSSVSASNHPSLKKSSSSSTTAPKQHQQHKTKAKGLHHIFTKLKSFLVPSSKTGKTMRSTTASREISSTNRLRQYRQQSPIYDVLPSSSLSSTTNNNNNNNSHLNNTISHDPVSIPFVYYQNSPSRQSRATYEKISAWLKHTEKSIERKLDSVDSLFSNSNLEQSRSSLSSLDINHPGINIIMKKTPTNIKPPKRSSSLVSRITRPIIEQQIQKTITPSSSFSSSILMRGMSERMTPPPPPPPPPPPQQTNSYLLKLNRPRKTDSSRRRTVASINEYQSNKENRSVKTPDKPSRNVYPLPFLSSNNKVEIHIPPSKHLTAKQYYFLSNPSKTSEDLLNNSYGLTLLSQQQQQAKHSNTAVLLLSQKRIVTPRTSIQKPSTLESLDDLLCDREVESYFYPTNSQSEHVYMNLGDPLLSSSVSYCHGTLC